MIGLGTVPGSAWRNCNGTDGVDPADAEQVAKNAERYRQQCDEDAGLHRVWEEQSDLLGGVVFVGAGSRWYAFEADAELMVERGACRMDECRIPHTATTDKFVPMISLPISGKWIDDLRREGLEVHLVHVRRSATMGWEAVR